MNKNTKRKIIKWILISLAAVLVLALAAGGLFWNRYINKNNLLEKYSTSNGQEIYLLGTIHQNHFNKWFNYSMEDILSTADKIQPDVVFIEAREDSFVKYGIMDGPIDMAVMYSYCIDNKIPVEMIDWWIMDNNYKSNSTNDIRDDMIFNNILDKCNTASADAKILVLCGSGHFNPQKIVL